MARTVKIGLGIALAGAAMAASFGGQPPGPGPAARGALQRFLTTDCEVGEEGAALLALLDHGEELEPELERLLTEGPDAAELAEATRTLEDRWEERQTFLESSPRLGLDPQALLDVLSESREAWIERHMHRFVFGRRERAALGLAAIGSPRALTALRRVGDVADSPLRELILSILQRQRSVGRDHPRLPGSRTRGSDGLRGRQD